MISTKGRYALRVMIDLAENSGRGFVPLKEIADRQEISKKYLEIIVKELVQGKLLVAVSGKGGGYMLARQPADYPVGEILELMEGTVSPVACLADKNYNCPRRSKCSTLPMWEEYDRLTRDFFFGRTLADFVK